VRVQVVQEGLYLFSCDGHLGGGFCV
jgi:hypothetical protein